MASLRTTLGFEVDLKDFEPGDLGHLNASCVRVRSTSSDRFEHARRAHAGADAHGDHAVSLIAPAQAMHERRDANRAGRAERVAERDGAAQRIDLGGIEPEILDHREALRGKRFVQLDPVDVLLLETRLAAAPWESRTWVRCP